MRDSMKITGHIKLSKYAPGAQPGKVRPDEVIECTNLFLTAGANELWALATGGSANHFDNSSATIGIGDNKSTTPAAGQTDLQATTNKTYKSMDGGYPNTPAGGGVKFSSTFGTADANYEWGEMVVKQSSSGVCLNRSTNGGTGWGTKTSGTTWVMEVTLSIS